MGGGAAGGESPSGVSGGTGVIACWPNQLFDESKMACTYWQDVDTSNCPDFDGSKMMPDQYDENANEERFFCGHSWSHARSICEPCPGGSKLECSDASYNCFAGVTGCPSNASSSNINSNNSQPETAATTTISVPTPAPVNNVELVSPATSNNNINASGGLSSPSPSVAFNTNNIQSEQQQPNPTIVFVNPNPPTTTASFTNNEECTTHSDCQGGKFCNEGFCGQCSNEGMGCSIDQVCRTASCHVTQKEGPGICYDKEELHNFCRVAWKDESYQCNFNTMVCESSSSVGQEVVQGDDEETATSTTSGSNNVNQGGSSSSTATMNSASPLYTNPQGNNFFCGMTFSSVELRCLQSKPCPNGFASEHCAAMEGCFRVSKCGLEYAAASTASANESAATTATTTTTTTTQQPAIVVNPTAPPTVATSTNTESGGLSPEIFITTPPNQEPSPAVVVTNPEPPTNYWTNYKQCTSHAACPTGQFCNEGFCGQCSHEGMGCSVDEVCRTASCDATQNPGPGKCYRKEELHSFCQVVFKDESYQCNLDLMVCESTSVIQVAVVPQTTPNDPAFVAPTTTSPPTKEPTTSGPTKAPTTSGPTKAPTVNKFFCGTTWQAYVNDCENATPCPRGDECAEGYTCFAAGSPCAKKQGSNAADVTATTTAATVTATTAATTTSTTVATTSKSPVITDSNTSSDEGPIGDIAILNGDTNQSPSDQTTGSKDEITIKNCDVCDGAGQLDLSQTVMFEGKSTSCGEFGWIFGSQNVLEGSEICLNYRSTYSGQCCFNPPSNGCALCDTGMSGDWYDVRVDAKTTYNGESDVSCTQVSNQIRSKIESSSAQCAEVKRDHFDTCCFNKCSICGDLQVDWDATVFYDGKEVSCHELDGKIIFEEGIAMGSDTCLTSQELYSTTCCINPPENPCNLCRSGDNDFLLKSDVNVVSATGETESCLEVFQSLLSRSEHSSVQCLNSQKELQAKCCDGGTFDDYNAPVPSPGVDWSPSVDEPAGYPTKGFYYTSPDWNENWNSSCRITSTATALALLSISWVMVMWQ
jgi:hypothetical protein